VSLPIVGEHAARVGGLPPIHRDPFDRMLVAQALTEPLRLVTDDVVLGGYGEIVTVV
jgi:PIN domain nuclease of toxin-antitoxin system